MLSEPKDPPPIHDTIPDSQPPNPVMAGQGSSNHNPSSMLSSSGISSWAKSLSFKSPQIGAQEDSPTGNDAKSKLSRLTSGLGLRFIPAANTEDKDADAALTGSQNGVLESLKKGFVDSSKSAVKAVQVKARHMVSQNKRRYQEGGFDLDMTYITENIIAMGFPAGDLSSGFFGYVEGFYRNDMDEVVKFLETYHKGKYKVYNLCSERLYDASLFEGKAASFPFDDHNCPPLHLIPSFCQSAYSWLKEDIENVVVIHCKAGMGRTGLMIASLLLYLKFCPTSEESIDLFNQKRCIDGKGLVLPSQIRYVKYFERILRDFNGVNQPGRRCLLRGFRLHGCPYWIRPSITILNHSKVLFTTKKHPKTKDLMPEDFWINTSKKGIVVFALPGEPGLSEVTGDFKIHFQDRHGDFYCWLNTTMMENRTLLSTDELDGFDKRKLPSPKFVVEIVMIDYDGTIPKRSSKKDSPGKVSDQESSSSHPSNSKEVPLAEPVENKASRSEDRDDVFSDSDGEEKGSEASEQSQTRNKEGPVDNRNVVNLTQGTEQMSISSQNEPPHQVNVKTGTSANANKDSSAVARTPNMKSPAATDFKAMAADASVFSFGDEEDYESE